MNRNRLLIAVVVLLGLSGAVVATMRAHAPTSSVEKPTASLPKLEKDKITALEIANPEKQTVVLSKQGDSWALTSPVSAKADQTAVDSVLEKLSELEVSGVAASRKENHARLEVDEAKAIRVKVKAGDKQLAELLVGASKGGSTMVRLAGQEQVLAVRGSMRYAFDKELKLFRDRVILDVDAKELTGLSLRSSKGSFKFEKSGDDASWAQSKGEKPIARFSGSKVSSLVSTLARLRAADFADPSETVESAGLTAPTATAVLTKKDGTTSTLELGKQHASGREYYVRLVGNDVIYRIANYTAERLISDASGFQEAEKKAGDAAPAPAPSGAPGAGQQIPPEILKQLQQQLGQGASPH